MPSRYDDVIAEIAAYACRGDEVGSDEAFATARLALMDSIGCAFLALGFPACRDFLASGESFGETPDSVPVPGTQFSKPASAAAFDLTAAIRWLDFNDTWLANEWGHPSDNFGAILAPAYRVASASTSRGDSSLNIRDVLELAIRAYEIQGVLALDNAFNRVGIDHVLLVKVHLPRSQPLFTPRMTRKSSLLPFPMHGWMRRCELTAMRRTRCHASRGQLRMPPRAELT